MSHYQFCLSEYSLTKNVTQIIKVPVSQSLSVNSGIQLGNISSQKGQFAFGPGGHTILTCPDQLMETSQRSVGADCSKLCTMAQFVYCTTCCTSGCTILWKQCTIKCGQCTINSEQCKIVARTITCHITRDMQHFSTMQIVFASLFIWCKCCAWCSQQFSLSVKFCNCWPKVKNLCTISQQAN